MNPDPLLSVINGFEEGRSGTNWFTQNICRKIRIEKPDSASSMVILLGASEVSANLYCNSRTSVLGRLRDYLRLLIYILSGCLKNICFKKNPIWFFAHTGYSSSSFFASKFHLSKYIGIDTS